MVGNENTLPYSIYNKLLLYRTWDQNLRTPRVVQPCFIAEKIVMVFAFGNFFLCYGRKKHISSPAPGIVSEV